MDVFELKHCWKRISGGSRLLCLCVCVLVYCCHRRHCFAARVMCVRASACSACVRACLFLGYRSAKLFMGDRALHVFTHRADHKEQHDARADLSCTLFHRG